MTKGPSAKKRRYVDFDVVKEPWNRYRLKDEPDDVDLLGKLILQKVVKIQGSKKVSLGSQNIFVTWAPESLKGKPSRSIPPFNTIPDKEKREVQFEILHEDWNHYTLKTGRDVKIRLIVSHIFRTKYFANDGDPYYIVNSLATAEETPKKASALTP